MRSRLRRLEEVWETGDKDAYSSGIRSLCSDMTNVNNGDRHQRHSLIFDCFNSLSAKEPDTHIVWQFKCLHSLYSMIDYEGVGAEQRAEAAKVILHVYARLVSNTDPTFDFSRRPFLNISPPLETGLPSGVSPDSIKDENLRRQYEEEIRKNAQHIKAYNMQSLLRRLKEQYGSLIEQCLIGMYSQGPADELHELLNQFKIGEDAKDRIRRHLRKTPMTEEGGKF